MARRALSRMDMSGTNVDYVSEMHLWRILFSLFARTLKKVCTKHYIRVMLMTLRDGERCPHWATTNIH